MELLHISDTNNGSGIFFRRSVAGEAVGKADAGLVTRSAGNLSISWRRMLSALAEFSRLNSNLLTRKQPSVSIGDALLVGQ